MTFVKMPAPAKVLATCVIMTLAFGMVGALAQVWIHDVIPTFFAGNESMAEETGSDGPKVGETEDKASKPGTPRGDLFADLTKPEAEPAKMGLVHNEQFVWTLKWSHIHLFGMNMIFIFMGALTLFLDVSSKARTWLIVLPFVGVLIDILAMWLKGFVAPAFFWLHIPGGGLFAVVFSYVALRALWEMWWTSEPRQISKSVKSSV